MSTLKAIITILISISHATSSYLLLYILKDLDWDFKIKQAMFIYEFIVQSDMMYKNRYLKLNI